MAFQVNDTVRVKDDALELPITPAFLLKFPNVTNRWIVRDVQVDGDGDELIKLDCCMAVKNAEGGLVCKAHLAELFELCEIAATEECPEAIGVDRESVVSLPFLGEVFRLGHYAQNGNELRMEIQGLEPIKIKGALGKFGAGLLTDIGLM